MLPVLPNSNSPHIHLDNNNSQPQRATTKSSPSMIFRIEHLLPSAEAMPSHSASRDAHDAETTSNTGTGTPTGTGNSSKRPRNKRGGVFAAQFIPKDIVSENLHTLHLMNVHMPAASAAAEEETAAGRVYCSLTQHNHLSMTPLLLRSIKLSEDIHSYNALFELSNGCVRVRIVRDVARDDELIGWFNEELTLLMAMPFLTPLNIQGNKRYTCHLCRLTFETPNPLKIHLALGCGHYSMDILWIRLHYAIKATQHTQQMQMQQHSLLLPSLYAPPSPPHNATSSTSSISPASTPPPAAPPTERPTNSAILAAPSLPHRLSAFKPISPSSSASLPIATISSIVSSMPSLHASMSSTAATSTLSFLPSISSTTVGLSPHMSLLQPPTGGSSLNAAAQIEAIVSNMGTSKQGHLCIYCGKIYSRKYGLKIHIRTHTGFKPLKCKFCLRPFGDPSNLNKHVRLHLQSNAGGTDAISEGYKCHLCHKTLARRRDLQRHIESRHGSQELINLTDDKPASPGGR